MPKPAYRTLTRNSVEGFAGEEWCYRGRTSFFEQLVWYPNFTKSGFRLNFDAGMATALSQYLSWNLAYSSRYLGDPPRAGIKKNDTLLSTGIRFTFTK